MYNVEQVVLYKFSLKFVNSVWLLAFLCLLPAHFRLCHEVYFCGRKQKSCLKLLVVWILNLLWIENMDLKTIK